MIYRAAKGAMWDPSVFWHDGRYHAVMMHNPDGTNGLDATRGLIAVSDDGVHWQDGWEIMPERELSSGTKFFKAFIARIGPRFILNHGVFRKDGRQNTLRFYESCDLRNWTYLFSSSPDAAWYNTDGRWDHMYALPKDEADPAAGFWGYPVATTKPGLPRALGMTETLDGRAWKTLPPPEIEWGDTPQKDLEIGGCERIGGKYVIIGGEHNYLSGGYSMYTLVGDGPRGPFRPAPDTFRLCGTSSRACGWGVSFLAAWARGKDGELLISNYAAVPSGTWLLPLRKAVYADGHLRLGWWPKNDALKGEPIASVAAALSLDAAPGERKLSWLAPAFDLERGMLMEGSVCANAKGGNGAAGFAFMEPAGRTMEIRLGIGADGQQETHIGRYDEASGFKSEDTTGQGCATVRGLCDGVEHRFRLLVRHDLFELYVDDLLMQTYTYRPAGGRVGLLTVGAKAVFDRLQASVLLLGPSAVRTSRR